MKKTLLIVALVLLMATLLLAACDNSQPGNSVSDPSETDGSSAANPSSDERENSEGTSASQGSDSSETSDESESELEVLYCSYSEKPYFAMVGRCAEGATVTAVCNGETVSSESYKGWFSLRLRCDEKTVQVKLSQSVNGTETATLDYKARPKTPASSMWGVVTGKNFQFFFEKMLPDFQGETDYSDSTYNALTSRVQTRISQLRTYNPNAEIVYLVVPSSMTVYPELVPDEYTPAAGATRLDKTVDALNAAGATVIDLKTILTEHKNDEMPIYYKLDSHWSDYGAYVAYDALFDHISQRFPDAAPRGIDEFDWNPDYYQSGDMTYYLQMSQTKVKEYAYYRTFNFDAPSAVTSFPRYRSSKMLCYSDEMTYSNTIRTNRSNLPTCTVIRDSYSTQIYDLIAERSDTTYYHAMWDYTWNTAVLAQESPDYIIYIVAEWNLDSIVY